MSVINYLGLAITRDALTQYYNANDNANEVYSRINSLLENVVNDTNIVLIHIVVKKFLHIILMDIYIH